MKQSHNPVLTLLAETDDFSIKANQFKEQLNKLQNAADSLVEKAVSEMKASTSHIRSHNKMEKSLHQRIRDLESRIYFFSSQIMSESKTQEQCNALESELRVAQQAIEHYRKALEAESELENW